MTIKCEMAGTVLEVKVRVGDKIAKGQEVLVLESMKMEVPVLSHTSGEVLSITQKVGGFVNEGDTLIELK